MRPAYIFCSHAERFSVADVGITGFDSLDFLPVDHEKEERSR